MKNRPIAVETADLYASTYDRAADDHVIDAFSQRYGFDEAIDWVSTMLEAHAEALSMQARSNETARI